MSNIIIKKLKELLCDHTYNYKGRINCKVGNTPCPALFYECSKCGKRKILRKPRYYYSNYMIDIFEMYLNHSLTPAFDDEELSNEETTTFLKNISVLNQIKTTINKFNNPNHSDSSAESFKRDIEIIMHEYM